jgi:hypothetical protein
LAAALWKVVINGAPKSVARKHLAIRYGHIHFGPTRVLDAFFEQWAPTKLNMNGKKMFVKLYNRSEYASD